MSSIRVERNCAAASPGVGRREGVRRPSARDVLRLGVRQAKVDVRNTLLSWAIVNYLIPPAVMLLAGRFGSHMSGTADLSITTVEWLLPGMLTLSVFGIGFANMATEIQVEREDGTLMRMRAIPHGVSGYICGKLLCQCAFAFVMFTLTLAAGAVVAGTMMPDTPLRWAAALAWGLLGMVCSVVAGIIVGCLSRTPILPAIMVFGFGALIFFSGLVLPITEQAGWLQAIAQVFPLYWLGLGMRSAFLPDGAVVLELGESWRTLESLAVVGTWTVVLLAVAPVLVRRMVRGVSGSSMAAARQRVLAKGY
ncbi:MAG: ABC transporter permease [Actinomycetaceae bacterium]|nr:ABC transporter permease [Actinomycetaceae bacterium]